MWSACRAARRRWAPGRPRCKCELNAAFPPPLEPSLGHGRRGSLQWLPARVMFDLPRWHTQRCGRCQNSRYLYGQTRALPLSSTTCSARTAPSTILRHRPPVTRPERSSDLFNDIHQIFTRSRSCTITTMHCLHDAPLARCTASWRELTSPTQSRKWRAEAARRARHMRH